MLLHLVRVGTMGQVGRFRTADGAAYPRHTAVVVRTVRGLEVGEVLGNTAGSYERVESDGDLLRQVTAQDRLLLERLERRKEQAFQACTTLLKSHQSSAVLMEVEHLFDGQSLFFYFLGEVTPALEQLTGQLAEAYETKVQFRRFAETLVEGCGPDCGTEDGGNCGSSSGGCSSCALTASCSRGPAN